MLVNAAKMIQHVSHVSQKLVLLARYIS